jgi:hypothetical protein
MGSSPFFQNSRMPNRPCPCAFPIADNITGTWGTATTVTLEVRFKCTNIMHPGFILYNLVVIIIEPVGYSYKSSYVSLSISLGYMWRVYILSLWECIRGGGGGDLCEYGDSWVLGLMWSWNLELGQVILGYVGFGSWDLWAMSIGFNMSTFFFPSFFFSQDST